VLWLSAVLAIAVSTPHQHHGCGFSYQEVFHLLIDFQAKDQNTFQKNNLKLVEIFRKVSWQ